jgi:TPR repeat protein
VKEINEVYQVLSDAQKRRRAFAPGFGKTLMGLAVGVGILFLSAVLLLGMGWALTKALPWLSWAPRIVFDICFFVLLPLCVFRKTRPWAGTGFFIASCAFGLLLFAFSCIVALEIWGYTGLFIGLFFGGVGVVPVAFLAALLHGEWLLLLNMVLGVVFTYGTRFLGIYLASGKQPPESGVNDDTHQGVRTMVDEDYSLDRLIQRAKVASPTGEVSPATRKRLETLSLELEDVNKKLEEHQEKQAWKEAQCAVDLIKEEVAREERKVGRKRTQAELDAEFDGLVKGIDKLLADQLKKNNQLESGVNDDTHQGMPQDYKQTEARFRKAAEQGNADAQFNLGYLYDKGQGVPQDYAQAAAWYRKAAEQGFAPAQFNLGVLYHDGHGVPQDYMQVATWFRKAAKQGDALAQGRLGLMYDIGQGVPQDCAQAAFWLRKAAERGDAWAQYSLGYLYDNGQGVPQDYSQAATWYRKAAEQGFAQAQFKLGVLYCNGQGVPQDYTQAAFWWRKAAEQGDAQAQFNLGLSCGKGRGVPRDYTQAAFWWRKSAEQGFAPAQLNLGVLYHNGQGVPRDYAEAYFWSDIAAAGKLDASLAEGPAEHRDGAASHLTPAELSRAQERVRKWFEAHQAKP